MCKTHKKEPFPLLEPLKGTQPRDNILVGKNPLFLEGVQLEAAGIERTTPLKQTGRTASIAVAAIKLK